MVPKEKIKRGCGIGCALLFVVFMILFGGTVYFSKQMGKEYEAVKDLEKQLVQTLGASKKLPDGYSGLPAPERVESFLVIREASAEWRLNVETSFASLLVDEGPEQAQGIKHFLRILKASRELAPVFSGFWISRNKAMLAEGMGIGEYVYLYCLIYNSWLGFDPSDGARDAGTFLSGLGSTGPLPEAERQHLQEDTDRMQRSQWAKQQVNSLMLPLLQQAARNASNSSDPELQIWAEILQQEIRQLQDDELRIPFSGNPPEQVSLALDLYRSRLETAYSGAVNPVELIFEDTWSEK